jgi:acyl-CoA synthetase (AMP-forming)/AMP-acid ligase II/thioesterase domain-containing protein
MSDLYQRSSDNESGVKPPQSGERGDQPVAAPEQEVPLTERRTIGEAIRAHAALHPEEPALVASAFAPLSYAELQQQIDEIGACLRRAGFDRHARIAVGITNSAEAALAIVAVAASAAAVPIDPKLTFTEVERCLRILRPSAVLIPRGVASVTRKVAEHLRLPIIEASLADNGKLGLRLTAPTIGAPAPGDGPDPAAPAFILHTSGTTADPNLVPFSHRNMLAVAERVKFWFQLTPQDRCLSVSPLYYSHGITTTVMTPLLTGGSIAIPSNTSKVDLSEWFGSLAPTWYSAGPTLHLSVLEKAKAQPGARTMHALRLISSAGAALPGDVREGIENALGIPVLEHYGSSETAHIASNMPPPGPCKPGTCGKPWPDTIIIVDADGRHLPPGQEGEILVGGPTVMAGYLNLAELNRSAFVDGWYRTGDIGSLDADGFLSLRGRVREMINRGSEKIAPVEIDHALTRHPEVLEAAAYGVPHPRLGEDVAAVVVLRAGASATPEELRDFLGQHLAPFKIPRRISIVEQLPKGITGKVQRKRLSETPQAGEPPARSEASLQAQLLPLWKKFLKTDNVSIDDDFFERGGDSLLALDLHLEIRQLTGEALPESILFDASTVRELAERLSRPTGAAQAPVIRTSAPDDRSAFVFLHGDNAEHLAFAEALRRALEPDERVVPLPLAHGDATPRSIEAAAAGQLPLLAATQPRGPYRLGGHGDGALIALELARRLVAAGHDVGLVALIDPTSIAARNPLQRLLSFLGMRQQPSDPADANQVPAPLTVPLLVFAPEHEGAAWREVGSEVEVINLPGSHSEWMTAQPASLVRYLRARLQSIGDSSARSGLAGSGRSPC